MAWEAKLLGCCRALQLLGRFEHLFNPAFHVERLLGNVVVLAPDNFLKASYRVLNFYVPARGPGELLGDVDGLRQEALDLARSRHSQFLIFAELVDAENCNSVLEFF